jgi:ABC-type multidrug transport system ATPase subunit
VVGGVVGVEAGEVDVLGEGPFDARRHRGRLSLLPQDAELSPWSPVQALLEYYAELQGESGASARKEAERVLEEVGLKDRAGARIRELSHGMRRRVAVAQALLGRPELVLLDEPTSGLDPDLVVRMRELFLGLRGRTTLVLSSHVLSELDAVCDHVIFLSEGRCTRQGPLAEVARRRSLVRVRCAVLPDLGELAAALPELSLEREGDALRISSSEGLEPAEINARVLPALLRRGAGILEVAAGEGLEAAWLREMGKGP